MTAEHHSFVADEARRSLREQLFWLRWLAAVVVVVPPAGSVLRHRFDLMFQEAGLTPPFNVIETAALLFITRMLQQSDTLCVMAAEVARYYASHGILEILPLAMPCHMDDFGFITRTDRLLSPGATLLLQSLKTASLPVYGRRPEPA